MHFIKSCNGKLDNEDDQQLYDSQSAKTRIGGEVVKLLLEQINLRLTRADKHFELFTFLTRITESKWNVTGNTIQVMLSDIFEFALKHTKKPETPENIVAELFPEISGPDEDHENDEMYKSVHEHKAYRDNLAKMLVTLGEMATWAVSELPGSQNVKDMWEYINKFSDRQIRSRLEHDIKSSGLFPGMQGRHLRNELIDGFMELRRIYKFFLSKLNDLNHEYIEAQKKYSPKDIDEANVRWGKVYELLQKLVPLKLAGKSSDSVTDFGMFADSDPSAALEAQLNEILGAPTIRAECK